MPTMLRRSLVRVIVASAAMATAACRPEDAKRQTEFTPGVYKGEAMPTLTKQQVEDLNKRGYLLR